MVNRRPRPQELTPAELEIMQILWDRESAFVNDIFLGLFIMSQPLVMKTIKVSGEIITFQKLGFLATHAIQ